MKLKCFLVLVVVAAFAAGMYAQVVAGGWSTFKTEMSEQELKVFKEAFAGFIGVKYTPIAVSVQVVNGTNYRFFCNALGMYPGATNDAAVVHIYQPLNGVAHITAIGRVN